MNVGTINEELQRRYLLGGCTDAELEFVEEQFLSNDGLFEELSALESELYVEYAAGDLTQSDRAAFEAKFLQTRDDRRRLGFADAFVATTAEMAGTNAPATAVADEPRSLLASLAAAFGVSRSALSYGMAAAVLLLAVGAGFLLIQDARLRSEVASLEAERMRERQEQERILAEKEAQQAELERQLNEIADQSRPDKNRITEIESQRQELQRQVEKEREKLDHLPRVPIRRGTDTGRPSIVALFLSPGLATRSPGESDPNQAALAPNGRLALTLELRHVEAFPKYRVVVQGVDDGRVVHKTGSLKAGTKGISLSVPASRLRTADYKAVLIGIRADGSEEEQTRYYFSVTR